MSNAFHIAGKIVFTLLGVLMVCMGTVWILQGLNIAFLEGSFMADDPKWAINGALLALVGIFLATWSVTRRR